MFAPTRGAGLPQFIEDVLKKHQADAEKRADLRRGVLFVHERAAESHSPCANGQDHASARPGA